MTSTIYRRESMAQLYEKLRAQDDDDDMAWLAQYSPDDKSDEPYVPAVRRPPGLSTISSASPVSSCSSGSSFSDTVFDNDSSDDHLDSDSDSDVDPEPLSLDLHYAEFEPSPCLPLIFQSHDSAAETEPTGPPYIPSVLETSLQSRSIPSAEPESPSVPSLAPPSIASRRIARSTRKSSVRYPLPIVLHDSNGDAYSESEGNGSEDEYIPSPSLGSRKRKRSTRRAPRAAVSSLQKQSAGNAPCKRSRHSPHARNVQATPGAIPASPVTKNNPWACPYCKWVQRNHRTPDLKRHIRTHTRLQRPAQWVCCGVPARDAKNYNIPADAEPYVLGGETMIGGCRKEFSRRDALKRHLDNDHISCIGDFAVFASICEDEI